MTALPVVVPAAGVGKRMGSDRPKQYLTLHGKTILQHTLERLHQHPKLGQIFLVVSPTDPYIRTTTIAELPWVTLVDGGNERADSVLAGLQAIGNADWVMVHDAARPCIQLEDINALLRLQEQSTTGGILATPVRDTMKRSNQHLSVVRTEDRTHLWHALTPQFFPYHELTQSLTAGLAAGANITDEASAMEWAGHRVSLVPGSASNIKITQPDDLALAAFYLQHQQEQQ